MQGTTTLIIIAVYFLVLLLISFVVGRKSSDNNAFFLGNRQSPWWIVAIGMLGSSISGVSFVSVPGMVRSIDFTYMQTVIGFFFGYIVVAKVLLPLYYRLNLTTIYTYLEQRFGKYSYKTGASFFLLSKTIGAATRLYIVVLILQTFVFDAWNIPFVVTACGTVVLIWLYTFRSGIKTIVWTDTLQTLVMLATLVLIVVQVTKQIDMNTSEIASTLMHSEKTRIFVFDDWHSKQNFFKQFFSGIFIVIVMTGLDQDAMQKNLTCRNLRDAQKNMYWYGISFIPVNFLFLVLGAMLLMLATQNGIELPTVSDEILPLFASQYLGKTVLVLFIIGIVAAAFSSADSALAALTTSFFVDILGMQKEEENKARHNRIIVHIGISVVFILVMLLIKTFNNKSVIDVIYTVVSYTYGPLLGMYAFGLFTKRQVNDRLVPYIAIASPIICGALGWVSTHYWDYSFGYELLMLNGLLTFAGLWLISMDSSKKLRNT
ncbi:sodium:solute symporter [Paludibacter sp. 221]|uniref:sodium:solute symporter n=1 Tax=Paludibacter sp. 221 TaxID=2302939 RepID=UPI0013D3F13E|nr:sodium:solute symporter [Paludibacter sp. 221]